MLPMSPVLRTASPDPHVARDRLHRRQRIARGGRVGTLAPLIGGGAHEAPPPPPDATPRPRRPAFVKEALGTGRLAAFVAAEAPLAAALAMASSSPRSPWPEPTEKAAWSTSPRAAEWLPDP